MTQQPSSLYHGGTLDGQHDPFAAGLWATDDPDAAADYAAMWPDATIHHLQVPADARIIALRDAVDDQLADQVEQGEPMALAASVGAHALAGRLREQGVWAVAVPVGDCHPDTGREHRSWWIVGDLPLDQA